MFRVTILLSVLVCASTAPTSYEDITKYFDTEARIIADGYFTETHHVTTRDGYILEINRIPYLRHQNASDATNSRRPVVFLMHGLQNSAFSYISLGPEFSIAYNLADAGFDVWMGNARGVHNSRNHVKLNPDDPEEKLEFFDFSFEEIAIIDVSTMIDYVLANTGRENLHYVGHSQGGTVFLVLNSMKPEYNEKFKSVHLLAGVGYQNHFPSTILQKAAQQTDIIYALTARRGHVEILGPKISTELRAECEENYDAEECELKIDDIWASILEMFELVAGAALKQFGHYGQNIRDKTFRRWNYGTVKNLLKYGRIEPPAYNLNLITADVTMHYTVGDVLLDERDVLAMANVMTNTRVRKLSRESFSHTDFVMSRDVKELVTDYVIEEIKDNYKICRIEHN